MFAAAVHAGPILNDVKEQNGFILAELAEGSFGQENLFDLEGSTVSITPDGAGGFTATKGPLVWDADFGSATGAADESFPAVRVQLDNFNFPFAGTQWSEVYINAFGAISFGAGQDVFYSFSQDRWRPYTTFGETLLHRGVPMIAAFFRELGGERWPRDDQQVNSVFVRQGSDAVVVTWEISESYGGFFDFTGSPRINLFQATLHADGQIDLSYKTLRAQDGIAGVIVPAQCGTSQLSESIDDALDSRQPGHIDIDQARLINVPNCALRVEIDVREMTLPEGDPTIENLFYRAFIDLDTPFFSTGLDDADISPGVAVDGELQYIPSGPDTENVSVSGNTISFELPVSELQQASEIGVFLDAVDFSGTDGSSDHTQEVAATAPAPPPPPGVDISSLDGSSSLPRAFFETFHFATLPERWEIMCEIIDVTGDRFDLAAYFTDFRFDIPEAGAKSSGPIGDSVTGLGVDGHRDPADWCSDGRLGGDQDYVSVNAPIATRRGTMDGEPFENFGPQVGLMSHELGHRWLAYPNLVLTAAGTVEVSDPVHWTPYTHMPSARTISGPYDTSPMSGNFWFDNGDGTFSSPIGPSGGGLFPPKGYSHLDLYLMGLLPAESVPDFFVIENPEFIRTDPNGDHVVSGNRVNVTIEDVIDTIGPRNPPAGTQTHFELGLIGIVKPGQLPSSELVTRITGIGQAFEAYWTDATDELSTLDSGTDDVILFHSFE